MKRYSLHTAALGMLLFVVAACASGGVTAANSSAKIVILYASDLHSQLVEGTDDLGGYARLQSIVKKEREQAGPKTDVLVVFGGDQFGKGRLPCRKTNDVKCAPLLGLMKPDVVAFGNGELKIPQAELQKLAAQVGGVWIGTNVESLKSVPAFWKPSFLYVGAKSGLKINFISSTVFPGPGEARSGGQLDFIEHSALLGDLYQKLGHVPGAASVVIVHDDLKRLDEIQQKLCAAGQRPLLIFKAHEHKLEKGKRGCLPFFEADAFGKHIARVEVVATDAAYRLTNVDFLAVNADVGSDPDMAKQVDALYQEYGQGARKVLFGLEQAVGEERVGKFLALAYQKTSKADIAIVNAGAIKQGLPKGKVDWETVLTAVPYNNALVGLDWSVGDIERSLCQAAKRSFDQHLDNGSQLIFAGAELRDAGKDTCRFIVSGNKKMPKIVIDSYLLVRSARWLGKELKGKTFSYGLDTERALELGIERHGKNL